MPHVLNAQQQAAALAEIDVPLFIVAGPGSGKTTTVCHRVGHLLQSGVDASSILAITFTNKAAKELRERVAGITDAKTARRVSVSTFHSFGWEMVRRYPLESVGALGRPAVIGTSDQKALVKACCHAYEQERGTEVEAKPMSAHIERAKRERKSPGSFVGEYKDIFAMYEQRLREMGLVDFNDLISAAVRLLETHPPAREYYRARYSHVLVDEFQDTNLVQLELVTLLLGDRTTITAVGDDDQRIYSFRGANRKNMDMFMQRFRGARVVALEINYRSTQTIVRTAAALISSNTGRVSKRLRTTNPVGEQIVVLMGSSATNEAKLVCEEIRGVLKKVSAGNVAVLFRNGKNNSTKFALTRALLSAGVPFFEQGAAALYERVEVMGLMAYLRVATNPLDDMSCKRALNFPSRGLGSVALRALDALKKERHTSLLGAIEHASRSLVTGFTPQHVRGLLDFLRVVHTVQSLHSANTPPSSILEALLDALDLRGVLTRKSASKKDAEEGEEGDEDDEANEACIFVNAVVAESSLFDTVEGTRTAEVWSPDDGEDPGEDLLSAFLRHASLVSDRLSGGVAVTLSTIHRAKGLEFDVVFIIDVSEGVLPSKLRANEGEAAEHLEEERRLFHVAVTRAKSRVFLSFSGEFCRASPFLEELPEDCVNFDAAPKNVSPPQAIKTSTNLFSTVGQDAFQQSDGFVDVGDDGDGDWPVTSATASVTSKTAPRNSGRTTAPRAPHARAQPPPNAPTGFISANQFAQSAPKAPPKRTGKSTLYTAHTTATGPQTTKTAGRTPRSNTTVKPGKAPRSNKAGKPQGKDLRGYFNSKPKPASSRDCPPTVHSTARNFATCAPPAEPSCNRESTPPSHAYDGVDVPLAPLTPPSPPIRSDTYRVEGDNSKANACKENREEVDVPVANLHTPASWDRGDDARSPSFHNSATLASAFKENTENGVKRSGALDVVNAPPAKIQRRLGSTRRSKLKRRPKL